MNKCVEDVLHDKEPRPLPSMTLFGWYYPGLDATSTRPNGDVDRVIWEMLSGSRERAYWNGRMYDSPDLAKQALRKAAERFYLDRS